MSDHAIEQGLYPILSKRAVAKQAYDLWVHCPEIVRNARPGQFVHIRAQGFTLRRPISICAIEPEEGNLRIVFEVRGEGTAEIAKLNEGNLIDMMGPLGHGFEILSPDKKAVVIGGGIGIPPLLEAARTYGRNAAAIIGFRSANAVILEEDFARNKNNVILCTDDGTRGRKGFVTEALSEYLRDYEADIIYACGPAPMLKAVAEMAGELSIRCQVSMEERMGCGVGACLVCACKTKRADGSETYSHVCKNGPVFEAEQIVF